MGAPADILLIGCQESRAQAFGKPLARTRARIIYFVFALELPYFKEFEVCFA